MDLGLSYPAAMKAYDTRNASNAFAKIVPPVSSDQNNRDDDFNRIVAKKDAEIAELRATLSARAHTTTPTGNSTIEELKATIIKQDEQIALLTTQLNNFLRTVMPANFVAPSLAKDISAPKTARETVTDNNFDIDHLERISTDSNDSVSISDTETTPTPAVQPHATRSSGGVPKALLLKDNGPKTASKTQRKSLPAQLSNTPAKRTLSNSSPAEIMPAQAQKKVKQRSNR